ncbi:MAG: 16S rRNA (uracil(1498)-N(3))-methyltransferase, partial [Chlamydiia bacterium]|nr:16S rRNA (uracil(1498)-N(3))-methyltransferase [Chlamydiia bacterium]
MPSNRYYHPEPLSVGSSVVLEGEEFAHLSKVMRSAIGDRVELADGRGLQAIAEVRTLEKRQAELRILSIEELPREVGPILILALMRQSSLEWVVEKATELGISEIRLFQGEKSDRDTLSENQRRRLDAILISALKQSGRGYLPKLVELAPIASWESLDVLAFFGTFDPKAPLLFGKGAQVSAFIVGPESGLTQR